jgi:hypothetical protein
MKRNLLIANIIFIAGFFLVILGMRNTSLDHSSGPKQRPRAVVENTLKAPIAVCCQPHLDAEACLEFTITALSETPIFFTSVTSSTPDLAPQFLCSRAPPVLRSILS